MRIVYCGSGEFGIECLNAILNSSETIVHIFTQPAQTAGRGRKPRPTPVASWAQQHSIPLTETEDINHPGTLEQVSACKADLLVVIAFGQKLSDKLISLPAKGAINVHASLLPKYRGAAPINWAIINGETETGVSIITLASKMDAGAILAQSKTAISPDETAGRLHDRLAAIAAPLLVETIEKIKAGTIIYAQQDSSQVSRAPKLKKADGFINWADSAESLRNKIRGLWPWPGAQSLYLSKKSGKSLRVTIAAAQVVPKAPTEAAQPGLVDEDLNVICGKDVLKITQIKPAGGRVMDFKDFVNGRDTNPGDLFMRIEEDSQQP